MGKKSKPMTKSKNRQDTRVSVTFSFCYFLGLIPPLVTSNQHRGYVYCDSTDRMVSVQRLE